MDEATARTVTRTSVRVMALLNQLAGELGDALPAETFEEWRRRIGHVMGSTTCELINPAVALHPALDVTLAGAWERIGQFEAPNWLTKRTTGGTTPTRRVKLNRDVAEAFIALAMETDPIIARMLDVASRTEEAETRARFEKAVGDLLGIVARDFIFPAEAAFPDLIQDR